LELNPAVWMRDARQYALDVRSEFRKVTWPAQREYMGGTVGVLVIVGIVAMVLGVIDVGLGQLMRLILP
jgi:preprotein translocase subunit SecE